MSTDIAQLGFDVNSGPIIKADDDLQDFTQSAKNAGAATDNLGAKSKKAGTQVKQMSAQTKTASASMGGVGRSAGMAGIQIQQFVGQVQGGQSAMVALSQQGADLGIVLGAPLVGVIVSLGAVLVGTLASALGQTSNKIAELSTQIQESKADWQAFTDAQRAVIAIDITNQIEEEKKAIEEKSKALNDLNTIQDANIKRLKAMEDAGDGQSRRAEILRERIAKVSAEYSKSAIRTGEAADAFNSATGDIDKHTQAIERLENELNILYGRGDKSADNASVAKSLQDEINLRRFVGQQELEMLRELDEAELKTEQDRIAKQKAMDAEWLASKRLQREQSSASEIEAIEQFYGRVEELRQLDNVLNAASLQTQLDQRRFSQQAELDALAEYDAQKQAIEQASFDKKVEIANSLAGIMVDSNSRRLDKEEEALAKAEEAHRKSGTATTAIAVEAAKERAEKAFEEQKKLDGALILANTGAGVMNALKYGTPGTKWLDAAAVAAEGLRQFTKNNSLQYGGGGSVSTPQAPAATGGDTVQSTQTTINISGNATQSVVDQLEELFGNDAVPIKKGSAQFRELTS